MKSKRSISKERAGRSLASSTAARRPTRLPGAKSSPLWTITVHGVSSRAGAAAGSASARAHRGRASGRLKRASKIQSPRLEAPSTALGATGERAEAVSRDRRVGALRMVVTRISRSLGRVMATYSTRISSESISRESAPSMAARAAVG